MQLQLQKSSYLYWCQSMGLRVRRIWSLNSWSSADLDDRYGLLYRSCRRTRTMEMICTISRAIVRPMKRFLLRWIQSISLGLQPICFGEMLGKLVSYRFLSDKNPEETCPVRLSIRWAVARFVAAIIDGVQLAGKLTEAGQSAAGKLEEINKIGIRNRLKCLLD